MECVHNRTLRPASQYLNRNTGILGKGGRHSASTGLVGPLAESDEKLAPSEQHVAPVQSSVWIGYFSQWKIQFLLQYSPYRFDLQLCSIPNRTKKRV